MAKFHTPDMDKAAKNRGSRRRGSELASPGKQAWYRFRRNKSAIVGMCIVIFVVLCAILAGVLAPYHYAQQDYTAMKQAPSALHWFGTDPLGRDILSRCLYGARTSLLISVVCVITSICTGGLVGTISGYLGGRVDNLIMRICDVFQAIPTILLAMSITTVLGTGIMPLIIAITISCFAGACRNFRTAILSVKTGEFVSASKAINVGTFRMILKHLVPNAIGMICLYIVSMLAIGIIVVCSLSYIGAGIGEPIPDWGGILNRGKTYLLTHPYMTLFPTGCIALTVFGFNLLGNGLRDALDPRLN